jgi:L-ascorbate metabolism protein UlaG (beta-lactamase superfamily)
LDISYLGGGGVKLSGRQITVLCDPAEGKKVSADVILVTSPDVVVAATEAMVIDSPGEYEVKGALITGIATQLHVDESGQRGTALTIEADGVKTAFLGNIAPTLTDEQLDPIAGADVLIVPVGGHGLTLDATSAAHLVSQIEPKYVIPTHYNDGTKYAVPQDELSKFTSELGMKAEPESKFKVPKEMPLETTLVVLKSE